MIRYASRARGDRGAFTVIELVVVAVIIAVLMGLLIPAVQSARESGRRSSCGNNMRQIGVAILNFNNSYSRLPSAVPPAVPPPGLPAGANDPFLSWEGLLLPYIEQQSIYDKIDQTQSWSSSIPSVNFAQSNATVVATRIGMYECPSVSNPQRLDGDPALATWVEVAAPCDYGNITGVETRLAVLTDSSGNTVVDGAGPGMMPKNQIAKIDQVLDGLSNTIMLAESGGRPCLWRKANIMGGTVPDVLVNGGGWARPATNYGLDGSSDDGTSIPGTCALNCTNGDNVAGQQYPYQFPQPYPYGTDGTGETFSFHPQGANIMFGDGTVKFVRQTADIRIFARLVTRAGQEIVSRDDLE